ncbi:tetratricopeptide repeat protein, partial [bacterium]|nr:tetratricopeptide repeat protein [bacterium]
IKAKEKGEQYLEKGLVSESNTFFKESLGFYLELKKYSHEELLELKITREELFYNLASLFFNINEIDKAKEIILSVVDEVRDKRYFISAGCIFIKSKEYDRALKYFEKAEKTDPKDGKINYYQGVIYSEKKDYSKAIIQFATAIKKGQKNANLYSNMGLLYSLTANYEESEKCYSKALELDSGNWQYYNILGNLNFIMGKPDKSRDYYLKALELSKNIPEIYYNLGTLELESENYKISKDYLKTLITRFPEFDMIKDVKNKLLKIEESIKKSAAKKNDNND